MKLIDSYNALPVGKYLEILEVLRQENEPLTEQVKILSIITDFTEEELLHLSLAEYQTLAGCTAFLQEPCRITPRSISSLTLGDWVLVPTPIGKVSTAQYIDFQTFVKKENAVVELLSVFLVPKGREYNEGYDVLEVQKAIRENLNVEMALSLAAFFLKSSEQLTRASQSSSVKKQRIMAKMLKRRKSVPMS